MVSQVFKAGTDGRVTAEYDSVTGGSVFLVDGQEIKLAVKGGYGVAAIGNSIVYASGTFGILEAICAQSGGALYPVKNAGRNGDTTRPTTGNGGTVGMTARFDTDIAPYKPAIVFAMEAVNNFGSTGPNVTPAMAAADMAEMAAKTRSWGGRFIVLESPTYTSNPSGISAYNIAYQTAADAGAFEYLGRCWQDGTSATDGTFIDSSWSPDGIHPTPKHLRTAATRIWSALSGTVGAQRGELPMFNTDSKNRISNGLFLTATSGMPAGWSTALGTHAVATAAGTGDVKGNVWSITKSASSDLSVLNGPFSFSGLAAGSKLWLCGRLDTTGFEANGSGPNPGEGKCDAYLQLAWSGAGGSSPLMPSVGMDVTGGVLGQYVTVPVGAVGATLQVAFGSRGGASISGVLKLSQLGCYDVPA